METSDNVRVVREIYEALGRGDVAGVLARMTEDARWDFNVAASDVPWHAPATGPTEIQRFLGGFMENVTLTAFEPRRFIASGEDVVVDVHLAYTVKRTGKLVDEQQLHWWSLAAFRVKRLRHFEDTAQVISAWSDGAG
ncbi:MAG TPA: nuclear transport factor 2 family protein [Polyangia bacterium]|jgi:ketosteroid isomerase-like protein|nr:nuclear transport factor 2 family protein [Polyangia bacterium]